MNQMLEDLKKELKYEKTNSCVQCGYCLPVCPTYMTMGKETHSPRGRINLVKMVGEGRITDLSVLEEPMNLCLGCRACETACPTGVEYGTILEAARAAITRRKKFSFPVKTLRNTIFKKVFPSKSKLNLLTDGLWLYQKTGLQKVAQKTGITRALPFNLGQFEAITPTVTSPSERRNRFKRIPAKGEKKYTVAFFTGCIMDAMFQRINDLSIALLSHVGCEVLIVENETCCGALHAHSGEMDEAKVLAKKNIAAFEKEDVEFIINNAGGCGAMLHEYDHLLADEPEWHERAKEFVRKSKDISQILVACGGVPMNKELPGRVTYQRSCHLTNVQKVTKEPVQLIESIPGIDFIEMKDKDMCCGSAGIYNIVNYDASMEILDEKMKNVKDTHATTIITTNPGCLLQMKLGIEREKMGKEARALHLVEYLAEAAGIV
ncbi:(Fe-S)-binding protein [Ammoniphilus resinae]|uniref:Glycolate oxidase iron-sulfur subunit n=1 Tax=Ammoniphilus resinae TaxID=861532 RepID=A0ABS4GUF9_9BACL|nr:(Fe-S)-binding protein [Ammoniphilus resinae]MBP1933903.1 glycolate oxidase iron-sulfur subunit [Ammoniphilus resinae]